MAMSPDEARGAVLLTAFGALLVYAEAGDPAVFLVPVLLLVIFVWVNGGGE